MSPRSDKKRTRTSRFGVSKREGHDSTPFYSSNLYAKQTAVQKESFDASGEENPLPSSCVDRLFCQDSRRMDQLPDSSVHLMVTSPPYNVGKEYDDDLSLDEYLSLLHDVFRETYRVLVPGGRACVNVANLGRKPYIPLHAYIIERMLDIGYLMRGEIIWNKAASSGASTAWGSWMSASNPTLRDVHEYILVFSKASFSRKRGDRSDTISKADFLANTKSVWEMPTESAKRVRHPAPFPVELPRRLIELYTFGGEVVLDPFCGSGSTCVAARRTGRRFVGYDINPAYLEVAERRLREEADLSASEGEPQG